MSHNGKMASFPVNLREPASLLQRGNAGEILSNGTPSEYLLLDWYGPFDSLPPSCCTGKASANQRPSRP